MNVSDDEREAYAECLIHEIGRGAKHFRGEDAGPAHPLVEALQGAEDLETLSREYGSLLEAWYSEDAIMRGEVEAPGPPMRETSPGLYE